MNKDIKALIESYFESDFEFPGYEKLYEWITDDLEVYNESYSGFSITLSRKHNIIVYWDVNGNNPTLIPYNKVLYNEFMDFIKSKYTVEVDDVNRLGAEESYKFIIRKKSANSITEAVSVSKLSYKDVLSFTDTIKGLRGINLRNNISNGWNAEITGFREYNNKLFAEIYWQGDSTDGDVSVEISATSLLRGISIPANSKHSRIEFSDIEVKNALSSAIEQYNSKKLKKRVTKNRKFNNANIGAAIKDPEVIAAISKKNGNIRITNIENKGIVNTVDTDTDEPVLLVQLLVTYIDRSWSSSPEKWQIALSANGEFYYGSKNSGYHKASFEEPIIAAFKQYFI